MEVTVMIKLTHDAASLFLKRAGITWSSQLSCSDRNNRHCTSFEQLRLSTLNGIITLKQASGCSINITGGTEIGHATRGTHTHEHGYKLDISLNGGISHYIISNFKYIGERSGDHAKMYESKAGNVYARESNHWDITYA
jgi:hypothetical protein